MVFKKESVLHVVLIGLLMAAAFSLAWSGSGRAQEGRGVYLRIGQENAWLNGQKNVLEAAPYIEKNRTMVPVRLIAEGLGGEVKWEAAARKVTVRLGDNTIVLSAGQATATRNGRKVVLDAPAQIRGGRTFVPVRFVSEAMGFDVEWDEAEQAALVTSGEKTEVTVAVQPTLAAAEILEKAKPLKASLERDLGKRGIPADVKIYVPLSQAGIVEALRFGHADVALMGSWPAFLATELEAGDLVLAEIREVVVDEEKKDAPYYYSYWVVPKDSAYTSLKDLRGKRACFPSLVSTSGYVSPMGRLVELGILSRPEKGEADPNQFFGGVHFAGGYAQCWEALKKGQVDVTIIAGDVPEKLYREVLANTRVLEKQGPIPSHGAVFSKALKEPLRSGLLEAFLALNAPEQRPLMRQFVSGIFVRFEPSTAEEHFAGLKKYLNLAGLKFTEKLGR